MSIIIKNGCIYNAEGEKIKPEFGNIEHIKAIRDYERKAKELALGIKVEPSYETQCTGEIWFFCPCGKNVYFSTDCEDEDDTMSFNGLEKSCRNCGSRNILKITENNKTYISIL